MIGMNSSQIDHFAGRIACLKDENERLSAELEEARKETLTVKEKIQIYVQNNTLLRNSNAELREELEKAKVEKNTPQKTNYGGDYKWNKEGE